MALLCFREHDLEQLQRPHPEAGSRSEQVVLPRPLEVVAILRDLVPVLADVGMPRHERAVVVGSEVVHVLDRPNLLRRSGDLAQ